jgi:Cdc6-like AAA superfamily ATPase
MKYTPRRFANILFPERIDRDDAFQNCFDCFNAVVDTYVSYYNNTSSAHLRIPIIALTAAPGSGKTFMIDELCELRHEDVDKFCAKRSEIEEFDRQSLFSSALAIKISYFGDTAETSEPVLGLCARILFEYTVFD